MLRDEDGLLKFSCKVREGSELGSAEGVEHLFPVAVCGLKVCWGRVLGEQMIGIEAAHEW